MTIRLSDRLGGVAEIDGGPKVFGRFFLREDAPDGLLMNSFPTGPGTFLVPDTGGRWQLTQGSERIEGAFPRSQILDHLDFASITTVGHSFRDLIERGGTWLDLLDLSPLVPGMSNRVELQQFELQIKESVGHLEEVCRRPRTHLRVDVERTPVSRARRVPAQAANYLAAHTEDWERPTLRSVIPKRVLALVREDQFDIYENRVAVRLVDNLIVYLRRRVHEVLRLLRIFEEAAGSHGSAAGGSHWRQDRIYRLWGKALDASEAKRKAEKTLGILKHLLFTISGLKDSVLYRELPRKASVGTSLKMTNILTDDAHYRRVAELWMDWARLGLLHAVRPREHFETMQDGCRSFDDFTTLVALRAFAQLGFEPTDLEAALSDDGVEVHHSSTAVRLSRSSGDGTIRLESDTIEPLRIIPMFSSMAMLDPAQLRAVIADADERSAIGTTTLVVYPSPSDPDAYGRLPSELARRLLCQSHELASKARRLIGFVPISPLDIGSVERLARQLRWTTTAERYLAYPPTVTRPALQELAGSRPWFDVVGNSLRIRRAPLKQEQLDVDRLVDQASKDCESLERDRELVSEQGREAVRAREKTGAINAKKKSLNAESEAAELRLSALQTFQQALSKAIVAVSELLICPTCEVRADPRRDFKAGDEKRFTCTCYGCSTVWGTVACGTCASWIPTIQIADSTWTSYASSPGWVDQLLGSDVLAVPWIAGSEVGFVCPACGASSG